MSIEYEEYLEERLSAIEKCMKKLDKRLDFIQHQIENPFNDQPNITSKLKNKKKKNNKSKKRKRSRKNDIMYQ